MNNKGTKHACSNCTKSIVEHLMNHQQKIAIWNLKKSHHNCEIEHEIAGKCGNRAMYLIKIDEDFGVD